MRRIEMSTLNFGKLAPPRWAAWWRAAKALLMLLTLCLSATAKAQSFPIASTLCGEQRLSLFAGDFRISPTPIPAGASLFVRWVNLTRFAVQRVDVVRIAPNRSTVSVYLTEAIGENYPDPPLYCAEVPIGSLDSQIEFITYRINVTGEFPRSPLDPASYFFSGETRPIPIVIGAPSSVPTLESSVLVALVLILLVLGIIFSRKKLAILGGGVYGYSYQFA